MTGKRRGTTKTLRSQKEWRAGYVKNYIKAHKFITVVFKLALTVCLSISTRGHLNEIPMEENVQRYKAKERCFIEKQEYQNSKVFKNGGQRLYGAKLYMHVPTNRSPYDIQN